MAFASKDTKSEYGQQVTRAPERIYGKHYSDCCNETCIMHPIEYWAGGESPRILLAEVCMCVKVRTDPDGKSRRCDRPQYVKIMPGPYAISEVEANRFALDGVLFVVLNEKGKLVQYLSKKYKPYEEIMKGKERPDAVLFASFRGTPPEDVVPF